MPPVMSKVFQVRLKGDQENPAVATSASGNGNAIYDHYLHFGNPVTRIHFWLEVEGLDWGPFLGQPPQTPSILDDVIGAHFHAAIRGMNGKEVLDWKSGEAGLHGFMAGGEQHLELDWNLDRDRFHNDALSKLRTELDNVTTVGSDIGLYADIHTNAHVDGEIRGQFVFSRYHQLNHASNVAGTLYNDVLFQNATDGQVSYAKMVAGAFDMWGIDTAPLGTDWKAVATGDVNPTATSASAETFVQQQSTGTIYYASLDTGATTWGVVSAGLTSTWQLRDVADVSGDASVDAIVQNTIDGTIYYADMRDGTFQGWNVVSQGLTGDWRAIEAGDITSDGFADVVVQQQSTGTTYFADMAGGAFAGWGVVSEGLTPDWQAKAVGDLNGDGFADVVFQNITGGDGVNPGTTYWADMANGVFNGFHALATHINANWLVEGMADFDNDGYLDVLFQNTTGGGGINPGTTYYADIGAAGFEDWKEVTVSLTGDFHVV